VKGEGFTRSAEARRQFRHSGEGRKSTFFLAPGAEAGERLDPDRGRGDEGIADSFPVRHFASMDRPGHDAISFTARLSVWRTEKYGDIGYVTIDGAAAEAIAAHELTRRLELGRRRGFGSVKVEAAIGASRWSTSVFPQKGGGWFLPVKKAIYRAEELEAEAEVAVRLRLL
jgi:hypothetical protein